MPTIVWFETDDSVYTMRQASRRSWRIGQTRPVQVVFMAYRNTLQADALKLVAKKLQSSLAVEGELPEDGLAAFGDDGDDLMLALARKIVAGEEDDGIASLLGVHPTRILVRGQRKRWASCAPDGTLRFNWRTVMAPPALVDYVVAHELAHLRVRGHGAEYWAVVAQAVPDYRLRRERLREVGARLSM